MVIKRYAGALLGLRFFAALVIMLCHYGYYPLKGAGAPWPVLLLIEGRSCFTSLFFVLSGFVLGMSLAPKKFAYGDFLLKRLVKLYPLHLVCFLLVIPSDFLGPVARSTSEIVASWFFWLTMTHGFVPEYATIFNASAWAVSSFFLGYLFIPRLLGLKSPRVLVGLAVLLVLLTLLPQVVFTQAFWAPGESYAIDIVPAHLNFFHCSPVFRLSEILLGTVLGLLVHRRLVPDWLAKAVGRDSLILACLGAIPLLFRAASQAGSPKMLSLLGHGLLLPLVLVIVVGLWYNERLLARFFGSAWMKRLGGSALLLYFLHIPISKYLLYAEGLLLGEDPKLLKASFALFLLNASVILVVSVLFVKPYDAACAKLLSRFSRKRGGIPAPAGASAETVIWPVPATGGRIGASRETAFLAAGEARLPPIGEPAVAPDRAGSS
ncbi:MAG: acyltransferase [Deltaproteobacteria bacterium]|nr:acyltransferase [Deltaproteobacteria bacterium]